MKIRKEQHIEFQKQLAQKELPDQLERALKGEFSKYIVGLTDEVLRKRIGVAIDRAKRYDIKTMPEVLRYMILMLEYAPNFDEHPVIKRVLMNESIPPEERVYELDKQTLVIHWMQVETMKDNRVWET